MPKPTSDIAKKKLPHIKPPLTPMQLTLSKKGDMRLPNSPAPALIIDPALMLKCILANRV